MAFQAPSEVEEDEELAEAIRLSLAGLRVEEAADPLLGGTAPPQPEAEPEVGPASSSGGSASLTAGRDIQINVFVSADGHLAAEAAARGHRRALAAANRRSGAAAGSSSAKAPAPAPPAPLAGGAPRPAAAVAPPPAAAGGAPPAAAAHHGAAPGGGAPAAPARPEPAVVSLAEAQGLVAADLAAGGRAYAVWRTPGSGRVLAGVHIGHRCWDSLVRWLEGGRYVSGRDRLRGADSLEAAVCLYEDEAWSHQAPLPPPIYRWP